MNKCWFLLLAAAGVNYAVSQDDPAARGSMKPHCPQSAKSICDAAKKNLGEGFAYASFLYWIAEEEALDLGTSAALISGQVSVPGSGTVLFQNTEYQPGFKIGIGVGTGCDSWATDLEYTWIRQTTDTSSSAPAQSLGIGVWFLSNWYVQPNGFGQTLSATQLTSKWHLSVDLLDASLGRPCCLGDYLTIDPFVGLRAAWIGQQLTIAALSPQFPSQLLHSRTQSSSWAIGPRAGAEGRWNLGGGWRIETDLAGSLLYTRYTSVNHTEDATSSNTIPVSFGYNQYGTLRLNSEFNLGFGWKKYFQCQKRAVDLSATYDFSIYWNQNLLRRLVDLSTLQINASPSNLYLHGLTANVRFDF